MTTIGIDLGGTKLLAGVVSENAVGERSKRSTPTGGPDAVAAAIAEVVDELGGADRIGVGAPGSIDSDGSVWGVPNMANWEPPVPFAALVRQATGIDDVAVENDVNVAALAEHALGAARGHDDALCLFMGTGVGGGLILDGKLRRGRRGLAGEIGHMVVHDGGRRCGCGRRGHVEAYAGRAGIEAEARRRHAAGEQTALVDIAGDSRMKSSVFAKALAKDDAVATELVHEAVDAVAAGIASVVMAIDISIVVVGGGLADRLGPELVARVGVEAAQRLDAGVVVPVVPAVLGDDGGVVGAALLVETFAPAPPPQPSPIRHSP